MDIERQSPYSYEDELQTPPPHLNIGRLVFTDEGENGQSLLARFAEEVIPELGNKGISVVFVPAPQEASIWVSAVDQPTVDRVLDDSLDMIQTGATKLGVVTRLLRMENPQ